MKVMKLLILLFGCVGLVGYVAPVDGASLFLDTLHDEAVTAILILAGFGVPAIMAVLGVAKPPFQSWQAVAALAGFVLVGVKIRLWDLLPNIADTGWTGKLMAVGSVAGVVVSAIAVAKPEDKA
jgi:hypothetical protein